MSAETREQVQDWLDKLPDESWAKDYVPTPYYRYPNYVEDLNAIHAAWKTLTHDEKMLFNNHILLWAIGQTPMPLLLGIEALPRCEAFLKTKGKWTE